LLRVQCGAGARADGHERFTGPVATADVLLEREVDERRDAGIVPERICRGIRRSGLQRAEPLEAPAERRAPLLELRALGADLVHDVLGSLLGERRIPEFARRGAGLPLHLRALALGATKRAGRSAPHPSATMACHTSSERNGMIGWRRRRSRSSVWSSTPRVRSAAAPPAASGSFAASTYQSQNSRHVNW